MSADEYTPSREMPGPLPPSGAQQPRHSETFSIDYADVLRQAVENERWRVLREVGLVIDSIPTVKKLGYSDQRTTSEEFKTSLILALEPLHAPTVSS